MQIVTLQPEVYLSLGSQSNKLVRETVAAVDTRIGNGSFPNHCSDFGSRRYLYKYHMTYLAG